MGMPTDIGIVDLMLQIPDGTKRDWYKFLAGNLRDTESLDEFEFPVEYMFKEVPDDLPKDADPVKVVLDEMDRYGIAQAMVGVGWERSSSLRGMEQHPDRFLAAWNVDPNDGMDAVRNLVRAYETLGIKAATAFPAP